MLTPTERERLEELRRKLAKRDGQPCFSRNCAELRAVIRDMEQRDAEPDPTTDADIAP